MRASCNADLLVRRLHGGAFAAQLWSPLVPHLSRAAADGVVARKPGKRSLEANLLGGSGNLEGLGRRVAGAVGSNVERAASSIDTAAAGAGADGVLKTVLVAPALEVVTCICVRTRLG